ncbi:UNVERIFIED_CONTAM: putative mitochondrial protein [Sesamum radiatum]|uniref:Mitochondrial protein n=1 Tax=Sesamum radiatum TaxID=300843 RepID=A0AAW2V8P3_SESRA
MVFVTLGKIHRMEIGFALLPRYLIEAESMQTYTVIPLARLVAPRLPPAAPFNPSQSLPLFTGELGGSWTVQHLRSLVRANNPSLVFLAETKCSSGRIESVKRSLDMNGFTGTPFTWCNGHSLPTTLRERLDRACANMEWSRLFPNVSVKHEPVNYSDHVVLIIRLTDIPDYSSRVARPWRFEAAWLQSPQYEQVVAAGWSMALGDSPIRNELESFAAHEETVWRQRSKILWLREGDRNTGFFHRKASHRFRTNSILRIRNLDGDWVYTEDGIRNCISSYFGTVYASTYPSLEAIAKGTEHVRTIIDASMRDDLLQPFTTSEVTKALFEMAPLKSPGPDAIANRMKPILDRIISPSQSAFVPGCLISDNILLAFELNHFLNSKSRGEQGWMALKLDMSKAYDKVEWSFLEQGDPLSPYLFLLCTEAFSSLLQQAEEEGRLRGIAVCRGAPSVSHLLFADDMLIFCQASLESSLTVREVIDTYRGASGQEINFSKSSVAFSRNTKEDMCRAITSDLTIRRENKMELYLGLPSSVARTKHALFATIRDHIWQKISSWNETLFSQAGKEVLIKVVIQAVPTYAMGCFKLPVSLLKEIQGLIAIFGGAIGLHLFNLAMLAKQLWRIMMFPERLLNKVLKARYFPNGDIFTATLGSRPSYTWRSIMAAFDLFRAGCRWRVGTGAAIRVWADPWLPRPTSFRPITPAPMALVDMRVSDLIDLSVLIGTSLKFEVYFGPLIVISSLAFH